MLNPVQPRPPISNNQITLFLNLLIDLKITLRWINKRNIETINHLKKTIVFGEISPVDNRPAIVFPAHPNIAKHNKR